MLLLCDVIFPLSFLWLLYLKYMKQMIFTLYLFEGTHYKVKWTDELRCTGNRSWKQKEPRKKEHKVLESILRTTRSKAEGRRAGGDWESHQGGQFLQGHWARSKWDPEKVLHCGRVSAKQETFPCCEEAGTEGSSLSVTIFTSAQEPCKRQRRGLLPDITLQGNVNVNIKALQLERENILKFPEAKVL